MSLVFSAIAPHPPIIIPTIGQENLSLVRKTVRAMEKLEKDFYQANPETVIIISPHTPLHPVAFSLYFSETYFGNFQSFGDLATNLDFNPDLEFLHRLKERVEQKLPIVLVKEENLDHGTLVPLYYLTKNLKVNLVPGGYSFLSFEDHLKFGEMIKEEIFSSKKRVAIIASGDLSHRLTPEAPGGYSAQGKVFDDQLIKMLKKKDLKKILELDKNLIKEAGECGFRSFLILMGVLKEINYQPKLYSYEAPFGVGYLVMNFILR